MAFSVAEAWMSAARRCHLHPVVFTYVETSVHRSLPGDQSETRVCQRKKATLSVDPLATGFWARRSPAAPEGAARSEMAFGSSERVSVEAGGPGCC